MSKTGINMNKINVFCCKTFVNFTQVIFLQVPWCMTGIHACHTCGFFPCVFFCRNRGGDDNFVRIAINTVTCGHIPAL